MRGVIKRSLLIFMILGVMGCNNGVAELEKKNEFLQALVSLGNDFVSVFTSFGDIVWSVLGLNLESKKSDVGKYFKKVQDTVQGNPNAAGVESEVKKFVSETLDKIIGGAKTASEAIGTDGDELIGNVAAGGNAGTGNGVKGDNVDSLVKGIKDIVDVVLKGKGKYDAGNSKKAEDFSAERTAQAANGEAGKLFAADADAAANAKKSAADAAKAVGAVTGVDILQAISKDDGAAKLAKNNDGNAGAVPKDATIAGGIALRAMAKNGKFANANAADATNANVAISIQGTSISAVTKALDILTVAIRKTIGSGLQAVKEAMKINPENTPLTTESGTAIK